MILRGFSGILPEKCTFMSQNNAILLPEDVSKTVLRWLCRSVFKSPFQQFGSKGKAVLPLAESGNHPRQSPVAPAATECQAMSGSVGVAGFQTFHTFDFAQQLIAVAQIAVPGVFLSAGSVAQDHGIIVDALNKFNHVMTAGNIHTRIGRFFLVDGQSIGVVEFC